MTVSWMLWELVKNQPELAAGLVSQHSDTSPVFLFLACSLLLK